MFARAQTDDVSNIHKRWSFTRWGPSSFKVSFSGSIIFGAVIIVVCHLYYLQNEPTALVLYLPLGLAVLAALHFIDFLALRGTPVNKLSKVAHVSLFANVLWLITLLLGMASDSIFSKGSGVDLDYIFAGMLLAVGLRAAIFTSVFGARFERSIPVSFLQPVIFFFAFVPFSEFDVVRASQLGIVFGAVMYLIGIFWVFVADRAGRPMIKSTFKLLQAFIAAWTENDTAKMEEFTEARAQEEQVETKIIKFACTDSQSAIILPDVHPGPFGSIGGSNLSYLLYEKFANSALVVHSVSDHSLNIPSKREVDKYLADVGRSTVLQKGKSCTAPIQVKVSRATTTGISFGNSAMLMLSLSPTGMDDIPQSVRTEVESHGREQGFSDVLVIDCHNAMGKHLNDADRSDLLNSAKQCLDELKGKPQSEFMVGFANLGDTGVILSDAVELGKGGLAVLVINTGGKHYAFGWADSNNMENNLRDVLVSRINGTVSMLEVCTSDTHSTSGKRTSEGYFPLGTVTDAETIVKAFEEISAVAAKRAYQSCTFELASATSRIKVMGTKQFEDYSAALDKSMNVTKICLAATTAIFITMLVVS